MIAVDFSVEGRSMPFICSGRGENMIINAVESEIKAEAVSHAGVLYSSHKRKSRMAINAGSMAVAGIHIPDMVLPGRDEKNSAMLKIELHSHEVTSESQSGCSPNMLAMLMAIAHIIVGSNRMDEAMFEKMK